ncbi:hypothetical protein J3F84DRAFT_134091 [Trichoderma pleuroticola]
MHHTTVYISPLHLTASLRHSHAIVSASQHLEKAAMGIRNFGRNVTDNLVTSWRQQWRRLRRSRYTVEREFEYDSTGALVESLVRRDTRHLAHGPYPSLGTYPPRGRSPPSRPRGSAVTHAPCVSLLDEADFTPPGSPTGITLGIPAEHLLDEHLAETPDLIRAVPPSFGINNPFATPPKPQRTLSDSDSDEKKSIKSIGTCSDDSIGTLSDDSTGSSILTVADPFPTPSRTGSGSPVRAAAESFLRVGPPNTSLGLAGGTYEVVGSHVVYTCNHCGSRMSVGTRDEWAERGGPLLR